MHLASKLTHPLDRPTIHDLASWDAHTHGLRAFLGSASQVLLKVTLHGKPVSLSPSGVKQDQKDGRFLLDPQVIIPNGHVEDVVRSDSLQGFRRFELDVHQSWFSV